LPPPALTVVKTCLPPEDTGLFDLIVDSVTLLTDAPCGGSTGPVTRTVGTHTVGESAGTGTSLESYSSLISGNCDPNGTVVLALGDSATCTITNERLPPPPPPPPPPPADRATLTVNKACAPADDPGRFELLIDGVSSGEVGCGGSVGPVELPPGTTHTVGEAAAGTDLAGYIATIGGACAPSGTVTLTANVASVCTITNARRPATLTVNKVCSPAEDTGRFDLHIDEVRFPDVSCGAGTGAVNVQPGTHAVREAAGAATDLSDYNTQIGGDCASDGTVDVPAGGSAVCTVTNTLKPPPPTTLRVNKLCRPADDDGHFNLTVDGKTSGSGAAEGCGGTTGTVDVSGGLHVVGEAGAAGTDLDEYQAVIGGDCTVDGAVTIQPGDQAVCTITNVRNEALPAPATLTVNKICVPSDDGGHFNLRIDSTTGPNEPCGGRLGPIVVTPGRHTVSETAGAGTSLDDYKTTIGGDCAADGSITLTAGQSSTCTITNARPEENTGQIVIENDCEPATAKGTFQVQLDRQQFQNMSCGETTGPIETGTGEHLVSEASPSQAAPEAVPEGTPPPPPASVPPGAFVPPARPPFKTVVRGNCSRTGKLQLRRGRRAVCKIIHRIRRVKRPPAPPPACYRFVVTRKTFVVGVRVTVVGRVTLHRKPVQNAQVHLQGLGASRTLSTAPNGQVRFVLTFKRRGIIHLTTRRQYHCPKPPEEHAGVAGITSPPVTG
jgi:hypothetical protein